MQQKNSPQLEKRMPTEATYKKYTKLASSIVILILDWLISRRHCTKSWQGSALKIREKINEAISDMPETTEITELLSGTCKVEASVY